MNIPQELRIVMDSLHCERLTSDTDNKVLIQNFQNDKNPQLPKILKSEGWENDESGICDYYILKDNESNILFFFAIRSGLVLEPYNLDRIEVCKKIYPLLQVYYNPTTKTEKKQEIEKFITPLWKQYELSPDLIISAQNAIEDKQNDRVVDQNGNTTLVWKTHPAVELAFFCQNSDCKETIKGLGFQRHFGSAVFWYYIIPKILKAQTYIGCEYVYLFAADKKNQGKLMDYYNTSLHFEQTIFLNGLKPQQDNNCFFMCQKVSELRKFQIDYLENFSFTNNPDINM